MFWFWDKFLFETCFLSKMPLNAYITPHSDERIGLPRIIDRLEHKFFWEHPQEVSAFLRNVLHFLDFQDYNLAVIDGILAGTPSEPKNFTTFQSGGLFELESHDAFTVLPYSGQVVPCNPIIQVVKHVRRYIGSNIRIPPELNHGDKQDFLKLYWEQFIEVYQLKKRGTALQGSIMRYPREPSGVSLSKILETLEGLRELVEKAPIIADYNPVQGAIPAHRYGFITHPFYIVDKTPALDKDGTERFVKTMQLTFI